MRWPLIDNINISCTLVDGCLIYNRTTYLYLYEGLLKQNFMTDLEMISAPSTNIPSAPAYGVYISQLIWYSWELAFPLWCSWYRVAAYKEAFKQGFQVLKLMLSLWKCLKRTSSLVYHYVISGLQMTTDMFQLSLPQSCHFSLEYDIPETTYHQICLNMPLLEQDLCSRYEHLSKLFWKG